MVKTLLIESEILNSLVTREYHEYFQVKQLITSQSTNFLEEDFDEIEDVNCQFLKRSQFLVIDEHKIAVDQNEL